MGFELLLAIATMPMALPLIVILIELIGGLTATPRAPAPHRDASVCILVPAHDEAVGLREQLVALCENLPKGSTVLLVADNCSDDTAAIARSAGVAVVERHDPALRGKGFALAFGRDHLQGDPPDVVIVIDADCLPQGDSVARLRDAALDAGAPVQAVYLLQGKTSDAPLVQISNFAFLVKNLVRQRGIAALGGAALLGGTGMAFPWPVFNAFPLATDDLVEDLGLGIAATRGGLRPRFVDAALVLSPPATRAATLGQRARWETGFMATMRREALPLIKDGLVRRDFKLLWLGLHLLVPPLALLMAVSAIWLIVLITAGWALGSMAAALVFGGLLLAVVALLGVAWFRFGRDVLAPSTLLRIPLYVVWKLPTYFAVLRGRRLSWTRTPRSHE